MRKIKLNLFECEFICKDKDTMMKTCGLDVHKDTIFCAIYDGKYSNLKFLINKFSLTCHVKEIM